MALGRGDDTVGNPHRAQIVQFELFELILLLKSDKRLPVEQFEATVSQSKEGTLPPLLSALARGHTHADNLLECNLIYYNIT